MPVYWSVPMDITGMEQQAIANFAKEDANFVQLVIYKVVLAVKQIQCQLFITIVRFSILGVCQIVNLDNFRY